MFRRTHQSVKTVAPASLLHFTPWVQQPFVSTVCAALFFAGVAQLAEHGSSTSVVEGSTPFARSTHSQSSSMNCSALSATATRFLQRLSSRASLAAAHASLGLGLIVCMPLVLSEQASQHHTTDLIAVE
jgi:hypothetical protein